MAIFYSLRKTLFYKLVVKLFFTNKTNKLFNIFIFLKNFIIFDLKKIYFETVIVGAQNVDTNVRVKNHKHFKSYHYNWANFKSYH